MMEYVIKIWKFKFIHTRAVYARLSLFRFCLHSQSMRQIRMPKKSLRIQAAVSCFVNFEAIGRQKK